MIFSFIPLLKYCILFFEFYYTLHRESIWGFWISNLIEFIYGRVNANKINKIQRNVEGTARVAHEQLRVKKKVPVY